MLPRESRIRRRDFNIKQVTWTRHISASARTRQVPLVPFYHHVQQHPFPKLIHIKVKAYMSGTTLRQSLFPSDPADDSRSGLSANNSRVNLGRSMHIPKELFSRAQEGLDLHKQHLGLDQPSLESIQHARQSDSQRSRLALSSRFLSPKSPGELGYDRNREVDSSGSGTAKASILSHTLGHSHASGGDFLCSSNTTTSNRTQHGKDSKSRPFSQTKPGKSLRQRLDAGVALAAVYLRLLNWFTEEPHEPPPYFSVLPPGDAASCSAFTAPEDVTPRPHSRSVSVLSSVHARQDDDISSLMMRGATDLRNAKYEIEEQVRDMVL